MRSYCGRMAKPLPFDIPERALGYETWEDWDYNLDLDACLVPREISQYYRAVLMWFASTPRYAFVCPCCDYVFPTGARAAEVFAAHVASWFRGGGCVLLPAAPMAAKVRATGL